MDKDYDIKKEMLKVEKVKKCLEEILERIGSNLDVDTIFNDSKYQMERYLLYKAQGKLNCEFDCDKTKLVKNFFRDEFSYQGYGMDTLISMQYIWSGALGDWKKGKEEIAFEKDSKEYKFFEEKYGTYIDKETNEIKIRINEAQKFIYELKHIDEIKKALGEEIFSKFCQFSHYYHTIGNISPCPDNDKIMERYYNCEKGFEKNCYDRLDLFMKTEKFKSNTKWVNWFKENKKKYMLEPFMEDFGDIPKKPEDYINYIDKVVGIIKERGKLLCQKK